MHSVVIKGAANAEAVLCTEQHTYALKIVETTNSLLLIPPDQVTSSKEANPVPDPSFTLRFAVSLQDQCRPASANRNATEGKHRLVV